MRVKSRNAGLTLIEYVVAFAILSVAALGIWGFYNVATRFSGGVNKSAEIYNEAQLSINQMEQIVRNTELGVYYDEDSHVLFVFNTNEEGTTAIKAQMMKYDETDGIIYYDEMPIEESLYGTAVSALDITTDRDWQPMAENVADFDLVITEEKNKIVFNLSFAKDRAEYDMNKTIVLRNEILYGKADTDVQSFVDRVNVVVEDAITNVSISITPTYAAAGTTVQLSKSVTGSGAITPSDYTLEWLVSDNQSMTEINPSSGLDVEVDDDGDVNISAAGTLPGALYFQAVVQDKRHNDAAEIYSNIVKLTLVQDMTLQIEGEDEVAHVGQTPPEFRATPGETYQLIANVVGSNLTEIEKLVSWELAPEMEGDDVTLTSDGKLTIHRYTPTRSFSVIARLMKCESIYVQYDFKVYGKYQQNDRLIIKPEGSQGYVNRGGQVGCTVTLNGQKVDPADCNWKVTLKNQMNNQVTAGGRTATVGTSGILTVSEFLSYDYAYTATVEASLKKDATVVGSYDINIPAVKVVVTPVTDAKVYRGETADVATCEVLGLERYDVKWSMAFEGEENLFFSARGNTYITGYKNDAGVHSAKVTLGQAEDEFMKYVTVKAALKDDPTISGTCMVNTPVIWEMFGVADIANGSKRLEETGTITRHGILSWKYATINLYADTATGTDMRSKIVWEATFNGSDATNRIIDNYQITFDKAGTFVVSATYNGETKVLEVTIK